jgi:uncharacterized repeat protein (TIGR03837 family)
MRWDLFCRVIDNLGDVGVCWRLACELARRGHAVRLAIDDASALAWMAPGGCAGVQVCGFDDPAHTAAPPAEVVVEAFGCDPPPAYVQRLHTLRPPPVWVNLEYLSAEAWVERSHALPSPQPGGLTKWFFFPGFTPRTGGLLREADLPARRQAFDAAGRAAWLARLGVHLRPGERVVTLFCYDNPGVQRLPALLGGAPTLVLLTPGPAARQWPAEAAAASPLRTHALPWLPQSAFDELLWASDLAFVRGEDSLVRAIWAGLPFVWQAYPQHDGVHALKLQALLERMALPADVGELWRGWNGLAALPAALSDFGAAGAWAGAAARWHHALAGPDSPPDLASHLTAFVAARRAGHLPSG